MKLIRLRDTKRTGILVDSPHGRVALDVLETLSRAKSTLGARRCALLEAFGRETSWEGLIGAWDVLNEHFREVASAARAAIESDDARFAYQRAADVRLAAPLPSDRSRVFAIGANFSDHATQALSRMSGHGMTPGAAVSERDRGLPPWGFLVIPDLVVGDRALVTPPLGVQKLDYEAEVAAVLGCGGRNLAADEVTFWGFTAFNDFSIRDGLAEGSGVDRGPLVWAMAKNFESGKSMGPCVTVDADVNVDSVSFSLKVNGELRQEGSTQDMLYSFTDVAVFLSRYVSLRPGDIICSGTPRGTALDSDLPYLRPDDDVVVDVEGVGELRNRVGRW